MWTGVSRGWGFRMIGLYVFSLVRFQMFWSIYGDYRVFVSVRVLLLERLYRFKGRSGFFKGLVSSSRSVQFIRFLGSRVSISINVTGCGMIRDSESQGFYVICRVYRGWFCRFTFSGDRLRVDWIWLLLQKFYQVRFFFVCLCFFCICNYFKKCIEFGLKINY